MSDLVEVIRCEDCMFWRDEDYCINPQWRDNIYRYPSTLNDDYCSYAERRDAS